MDENLTITGKEPVLQMKQDNCPKAPPLGEFKISNSTDLNNDWMKYKRAFTLFCDYNNVKCPKQKKLLFLMTAGVDVQDIYFNISGSLDIQHEENTNEYEVMETILDKHFSVQFN